MRGPLQRPVAVIPVHNEAATIVHVVRAALTYVPVIVIDDASSDDSGQRAAAAGAMVLTLPAGTGKGSHSGRALWRQDSRGQTPW
jgi:hypothetical protein